MIFGQTNPPPPVDSLAGSHTVETPEQTSLEFTVAGIGSRFLALLVDSLAQLGLIILVAALAFAALFFLAGKVAVSRAWIIAFVLITAFLVLDGYFLFFEILWSGQTPGKRLIGIRVIKDNGRRLSAAESVARNLLRIVDQMPGFYAIGMLVAFFNDQNKRLGDFVAGSLVVREASLAQMKQHWNHLDPSLVAHAPLGAAQLTVDDLILIESFLSRRYDLEPAVRRRMAGEILGHVQSKLTITPGQHPDVEPLLEAAAREYRAAGDLK